ncbi:hypothetical protein PB01_13120 [Psychrobacillus glaciei]|uniref:Uncharacterized protein n=1 Tax=Psychrobacillus glaciei TaxID=2283160 RepID=A0A5J6SQA8_9BACI|nr:hypothetical protein [Psychrobacillus glaciei]QFF99703.1 hypothetical protein PB01_13120 [Psychrobacillus glaciei]
MKNYGVSIVLENEESYDLEIQGSDEEQVFSKLFSQISGVIKIYPYDDVVVFINFDKVLKIQIQPLEE